MKCPAEDKLLQFADQLLEEQELAEIKKHVSTCSYCFSKLEEFQNDNLFFKETLQTPTLPEHFTSDIMDQLEPYKSVPVLPKKRMTPWKRILAAAAGLTITVGISATFSPALAGWIGGLFSSDRVDEGLQMASREGFVTPVNKEVTDNGLIFKVEDVMADSSRIAFSYQVLDENGKAKKPYIDLQERKNRITAADLNGKKIDLSSMSWGNQEEYGQFEFILHGQQVPEQLNVQFDLTEIAGKEGNWKLMVPVDLRQSLQATKSVSLMNAATTQHGVSINMKEIRFSPSASELMYETSFVKEELERYKTEIQDMEQRFGEHSLTGYGNDIQYHIENEEGKIISHHNTFFEGKGHPSDSGGLFATGQTLAELGHIAWVDTFVPQKKNSKLTFVLNGIFKTEPANFAVTFKPSELKNQPVTFEYEGNFVTMKEAKVENDYSLQKSIIPIKKERVLKIELEGGKEARSSNLGYWVLVDNKGRTYSTVHSGSILDETDENGRYKTKTTLQSFDFTDDIPEELTLQLLSVNRYYEIKDKWKVPLY
ncbi:DUF4179 domain-containing protein [Pseudoneobacillus rhizosphaerae]|uniref:DUF4179 domain-containing protein n=1 Tax=Pseudoneobacillus rhizosphaerae TaxID=2880968 RepID=A0A9C7G6F5_9BACI|nr:DUF4179 domain-containing protein [Pseudoneobacillus rhizosphaerae]CAG9606906.1 hypothetical protein NEOCIP111885_00594 [Pseudoneobacillus rhizosphaerae]